jgi:hypothetical protein
MEAPLRFFDIIERQAIRVNFPGTRAAEQTRRAGPRLGLPTSTLARRIAARDSKAHRIAAQS